MQGDEKFKKDRFVLSVAFSPNGERLACGSQDGTVAIFDVASGKFLHHLEGHFKPVRALTFTPGTLHCLRFYCVFTLFILLLLLSAQFNFSHPFHLHDQGLQGSIQLLDSCQK